MLILLFVIGYGMIIGSFLNVCIYRIPLGESIVFPGSHCMHCKHPLKSLDLIPVMSFISLGGRCRYCKEQIAKRYMLVELMTGILFGAVYLKFGLGLELWMYLVFVAVIIVLSMIDLDHMLLPTKIILFGGGLGIAFRILQSFYAKDFNVVKNALVAGFVGYAFFWSIFYIAQIVLKKEGLGFGDVRLMGMLGIYLSFSLVVFTIFIASIIASVYGIILYYRKKTSEAFPLGPFLNLGALIAVFWGEHIISWYLTLVGL